MAAADGNGSKGAVITALLANGAIAVLKFVFAVISGSASMFAEAWHSVADTGNQAFLLLGIHSSNRPPDEKHPFGYGKDQFFWSFVVAISLFTLGSVFSIQHGIEKLYEMGGGHEGHGSSIQPWHLMYNGIVILLAMVFESFAFRKAWTSLRKQQEGSFWKHVRKTKRAALVTVFFEDLAALSGLSLAGLGLLLTYLTGSIMWDGIASITIGLLLAVVALFLAYEARALLLGERADLDLIRSMEERLRETTEIVSHDELRTMHVGPNSVLVGVNVEMKDGLGTEEVEDVIDRLEEDLRTKHPQLKHLYVELADPDEEHP